jgi:hypothetical protein
MDVLFGKDLYGAILGITRRPGACCAVAFWGRNAEALFTDAAPTTSKRLAADALKDRGIRVVCNLKSGGTNPAVIESLMRAGVDVLQRDDLHAKVYFSDAGAVVASANASANGLGLQASEQAFWIEAGVRFDDPSALIEWFDDLWSKSRGITTQDLKNALQRNRQLAKNKPTLLSFQNFDPEMDPLPLVSWVNGTDGQLIHEKIRDQLGADDKATCDFVEWGEEVGGPEDEGVLLKSDWVLRWSITSRGKASRRERPYWIRLEGKIARKVWRYTKERKLRDVVLGSDPNPGSVPFDPSEDHFLQAFSDVIVRPLFQPLRDLNYQGSFFTEARLKLMRQFWRDLKVAYRQHR